MFRISRGRDGADRREPPLGRKGPDLMSESLGETAISPKKNIYLVNQYPDLSRAQPCRMGAAVDHVDEPWETDRF